MTARFRPLVLADSPANEAVILDDFDFGRWPWWSTFST